ncbi:MAG: TonB-dependent receptor [Chitinophagaceae bacterium]
MSKVFKNTLFFLFILLSHKVIFAQQTNFILIKGTILEKAKNNTEEPLRYAKISIDKTTYTYTDLDGKFSLSIPDTIQYIIVEHQHVQRDTIQLADKTKELQIVYPLYVKMKDITIRERKFSTEISLLTPQKVENINERELLRAACCNLSESFETTPSVDVSFTDAITGYKQIQLLGLAGPYALITRENMPDIKGLGVVTGLSFTPGQWIESIQLSKGTGSVVNGFEGLAGQINVEWRKPSEHNNWNLNIYQSAQGRSELNVYKTIKLNNELSTGLFFHAKSNWKKMDQNNDLFMDSPLGNTWIAANRWMYFGKKGKEIQLGVKYTSNANWGGQWAYDNKEIPQKASPWGMNMNIQRLDAWSKIGKVFVKKPWKSMGLQLAISNHEQQAAFGRKTYNASEQTAYANYIFQTIVKHTGNVLKLGSSFSYTQRNEKVNAVLYPIQELVPGIFSEYTHTFSSKLNMIAGLRIDWHQLYGLYITPRLHVRYAPKESFALRASIGKSYRTASIFAENIGYFSTNRNLQIESVYAHGAYGLKNEEAINAGINATYKFKLNYRNGIFNADYYYTYFIQQVVADWENTNQLRFYNIAKNSNAHSFQCQIDYELIRKFDIRLAYRMNKVHVAYQSGKKQNPLNALHRYFSTLSYTTRSKWTGDVTVVYTGKKRIPSTSSNPIAYQLPSYSPSFLTLNAQIGKTFSKQLEFYLGAENITNYMQRPAIVASQDPFGNYFDSSLIWGPAMGRNIYVGMRWKQ